MFLARLQNHQMTNQTSPQFLLFAQHGWSDNGKDIGQLAQTLVNDDTLVFAPSLGLLNTYWRINYLVKQVEELAAQKISQYSQTPLKVMGHSMGGLIWLEVLHRHPEWWHKIHSVVVIGSPIGGADLARMVDPWGIGIGIARDLAKNRRPLAEKIAQNIPTLSIASDLGNGSDGMVALEATKFDYAQFVCVERIPHAQMKRHWSMIPLIKQFWSEPQINYPQSDLATEVIQYLRNIPGITDSNYNRLERSQKYLELPQNITIRTSKNVAQIDHVFVTDQTQKCLYAGYVGWLHTSGFKKALAQLKQKYVSSIN